MEVTEAEEESGHTSAQAASWTPDPGLPLERGASRDSVSFNQQSLFVPLSDCVVVIHKSWNTFDQYVMLHFQREKSKTNNSDAGIEFQVDFKFQMF